MNTLLGRLMDLNERHPMLDIPRVKAAMNRLVRAGMNIEDAARRAEEQELAKWMEQ